MRTPIAFGLAWPGRIGSGVEPLDLIRVGNLDFQAADLTRFPCLRLGREAASAMGSAPLVLNAANEIAVAAFLDGEIGFRAIPAIIADSLETACPASVDDLDAVMAADQQVRRRARELVRKYAR